ncbi:MAG TPA: glycosyltransferase family 4 protein [Candidatus Thermoplasmatota archaeon]|nr:glycosyltransferase family 4 protein [Candidatus Thermoplasmatota archaeon]
MKASVTYPTYVHDLVEGVSKNVHHLRESLVERGIDATDDSPRVEVGDMNKKSVYVKQGVAAFKRVRDALRDPSTDLVHYHVSIPGMSAWAALAKARTRSRKPMVLHMWNPWFDPNDMHTNAGKEAMYHRLFNGSATTTPFLGAFERIVVSSEYQREQLARRGYNDVTVIPNGVDLDHYQPAPADSTRRNARRELNLPVDQTLLLYYGHLTPWKGVRVLVEALPKAFEENPDARLVIARTHYGKDEQALKTRLRELGLQDRVHFLGICEVPLLLQAVDAGVVPATAAVGTACHPNVVLEYHSAGVPIVASRVGSIPEAVDDGRTGLLANPGDPNDLGEKLQRLLADADMRRRMGDAARRRAESTFDWRHIAERYERTYADSI